MVSHRHCNEMTTLNKMTELEDLLQEATAAQCRRDTQAGVKVTRWGRTAITTGAVQ